MCASQTSGTTRAIVVRITDNGVGKGSVIDLCKEAAEEIDLVDRGVAKVRIEVLEERPLEKPAGS
jgi:rare lipoprotein A